jgi:bifunctional non-homologous end joining protein LigD
MRLGAASGQQSIPGRKHTQPSWLGPMLATLVAEPFSREGWIFEPKLDGIRCLIFRNGQELELLSRNRKRLNDAYPELVGLMLAQEPGTFVIDGEIVAFQDGLTSFARLQRRMQACQTEWARFATSFAMTRPRSCTWRTRR